MAPIVEFPEHARKAGLFEEHLAYYTADQAPAPEAVTPKTEPAVEQGLEGVELMYEYFTAA
ncbi:hypothetical protein FGG78_16830 [Thioclava sp. BHET1]|nr:hypothetical protein FGG78_16830 [Thioclava sp. BHET1]